ncbi:MAG TPA: TetR/AcrR family transcriptional regulator [Candidatus Limnocylindrales bacterium]|nr:TetR/AcrR family transcriptional regulator [Candidatus Limnocylindrales bacterium]
MQSKGEETREAILTHALGLATRVGFEGLTIGRLAEDLHMSKSGLFAHFRSKEGLQLEILRMAGARMVDTVVKPALAAPRGEPRVRALFERWLAWEQSPGLPGGCPFMAASFELDDRPGPVHDFVVQNLRDWMDTMAGGARIAVQEGHFRADLDPAQFAHDCQGIGLAFVHASRLMRDPQARARAATAFEALLEAARAPSRPAAIPSPASARGVRRR